MAERDDRAGEPDVRLSSRGSSETRRRLVVSLDDPGEKPDAQLRLVRPRLSWRGPTIPITSAGVTIGRGLDGAIGLVPRGSGHAARGVRTARLGLLDARPAVRRCLHGRGRGPRRQYAAPRLRRRDRRRRRALPVRDDGRHRDRPGATPPPPRATDAEGRAHRAAAVGRGRCRARWRRGDPGRRRRTVVRRPAGSRRNLADALARRIGALRPYARRARPAPADRRGGPAVGRSDRAARAACRGAAPRPAPRGDDAGGGGRIPVNRAPRIRSQQPNVEIELRGAARRGRQGALPDDRVAVAARGRASRWPSCSRTRCTSSSPRCRR